MAPLAIQPEPVTRSSLTPLYERPDGWSRVLAQLPHDAVLTPVGPEGHFIRVTTADRTAGYVAGSAPLAALKGLKQSGH